MQQSFQDQEANMDRSYFMESDSVLMEDRQALEEEKGFFAHQKVNFDEERRIYTEAAIRLAKEVSTELLEEWTRALSVCTCCLQLFHQIMLDIIHCSFISNFS